MKAKKNTSTNATTKLTGKQTVDTQLTAAVAKREPELSKTHELIIDAVSDMLTHGGDEDDIVLLLTGTMKHLQHRELDDQFSDDPEKRDELILRRIVEGITGWKTDLSIAWRANKRKETPAFEATTVSQRIRAQDREVLLDRFDRFLREVTPEETRLLSAIFETYEGGIFGSINGVDEVRLGEAFAFELDRNDTYIRIPKGFRAKVQKYVDALHAIEDKAA